MNRGPMAEFAQPADASRTTCLGRTCMKWTADGELSDHDFELIMKRLLQAEVPAGAHGCDPAAIRLSKR